MIRPKMKGQCCGNCRWLKITGYSLTGHIKPRWKSDAGGPCVWPQPEIILPSSITQAHGFQREYGRNYCQVTLTGCPTWEPIEENK